MQAQKQIWRVWNGKGNPPAKVVSVFYNCGIQLGYSAKLKPSDEYKGWQWDQVKIPWQKIIAYTSGEIKPSKRIPRPAHG